MGTSTESGAFRSKVKFSGQQVNNPEKAQRDLKTNSLSFPFKQPAISHGGECQNTPLSDARWGVRRPVVQNAPLVFFFIFNIFLFTVYLPMLWRTT